LIGDRSQFTGEGHKRSWLADSPTIDDVIYDLRGDDRGVEDVTNSATYRGLQVLMMMPEFRR
jgi:hypothetical protein